MKFAVAIVVLFCFWQQAAGYYCPSGTYNCEDDYNLQCVSDNDVCDGTDDCHNGRDEENCVTVNVGLAVGLAIGGFVLFIVVPIIVCVVICCCLGVCAGAVAGSGGRRTRVVTHTAPSTAPHTTVVSSNTSNMMQSPVGGGVAYPPPYTSNPNTYQPVPYKM